MIAKDSVKAEIARRRADVAARNGIKLDMIVQRLKRQAFTDITEVIGTPGEWPEEARCAVKHYDAGGPQSSEKVTLHDQPRLLIELWDRTRHWVAHGGGTPNMRSIAEFSHAHPDDDLRTAGYWHKVVRRHGPGDSQEQTNVSSTPEGKQEETPTHAEGKEGD